MTHATTMNGWESKLWASITGQMHYGPAPRPTTKIISYTVYGRKNGKVHCVKEKMSRADAIKSIEEAKAQRNLDSKCVYHINGDITIDLSNDEVSVVGHYKNAVS